MRNRIFSTPAAVLSFVIAAVAVLASSGCNSKSNLGDAAVRNAPPALALAADNTADGTRNSTDANNNSSAADHGDNGKQANESQTNSASQATADEKPKTESPDPKASLDDETKETIKELQTNLDARDAGKPFDFKPSAARISKRLETEFNEMQARLAIEAGEIFMEAGAYDLTKQVYSALEKATAHSDNTRLADGVKEAIKPALARLDLLGTKPKIEGTIMGGEKFDWSKYKGKVVLLDFWATWCGPCRAELPNVKKAYDKFHDQGFDVVGISLDDDQEKLSQFLATEKLPWTTLFSEDPAKQGWEGAAMTGIFGITAIPATFLIDRSGKLVSLSARGEELQSQIEKLLAEKK